MHETNKQSFSSVALLYGELQTNKPWMNEYFFGWRWRCRSVVVKSFFFHSIYTHFSCKLHQFAIRWSAGRWRHNWQINSHRYRRRRHLCQRHRTFTNTHIRVQCIETAHDYVQTQGEEEEEKHTNTHGIRQVNNEMVCDSIQRVRSAKDLAINERETEHTENAPK